MVLTLDKAMIEVVPVEGFESGVTETHIPPWVERILVGTALCFCCHKPVTMPCIYWQCFVYIPERFDEMDTDFYWHPDCARAFLMAINERGRSGFARDVIELSGQPRRAEEMKVKRRKVAHSVRASGSN